MSQTQQMYENNIDSFIYSKYPTETPAYQAILRERVLDLCTRKILPDNASVYLKSGGWNPGFAEDYREFLQYCNHLEKEYDMANDDKAVPMFTKKQVQQLLEQLVYEFAESAGYPSKDAEEDIKEYRKGLMEFIKTKSTNSISDAGIIQLEDYLTQIKEMSSAMLAYVQQVGK